MPKCGGTNYDVDIVSQEINISDDPDILDYWRCLIGRGASPQIVIDLDGPRTTLYINSVVVEDTWYPGEFNYLILSFYLQDNRRVVLEFYVPSDDPGGGS